MWMSSQVAFKWFRADLMHHWFLDMYNGDYGALQVFNIYCHSFSRSFINNLLTEQVYDSLFLVFFRRSYLLKNNKKTLIVCYCIGSVIVFDKQSCDIVQTQCLGQFV